MLAQLCHASTVSTQWWNATEGNKAALNTSGHAGPQGVSSPNFSPEQAQMRGQTRLLKALSHGGWKPSRLGNGTTFLGPNPAPWLSSLKVNLFLKSSLNKTCFRYVSHTPTRGTTVKSSSPSLWSTPTCTGALWGPSKPTLPPLNQSWLCGLSSQGKHFWSTTVTVNVCPCNVLMFLLSWALSRMIHPCPHHTNASPPHSSPSHAQKCALK